MMAAVSNAAAAKATKSSTSTKKRSIRFEDEHTPGHMTVVGFAIQVGNGLDTTNPFITN